jgi:hypothetical protein
MRRARPVRIFRGQPAGAKKEIAQNAGHGGKRTKSRRSSVFLHFSAGVGQYLTHMA